MKWFSLSKTDSKLISLKKTKELVELSSKEECINFIHKKNPNKGKITSRELIGPLRIDEFNYWMLYYKSPINKKCIDTEWSFRFKNNVIKTYNGIVVIKKKDNALEPLHNDIEDMSDDDLIKFKKKISTQNLETENNNINNEENEDDEEIEDNDENDDEEILNFEYGDGNNTNLNMEDDDNNSVKGDDLFDESVEVIPNLNKIEGKSINQLEIEQKHVLVYEVYSYNSPAIPNKS